MADANRTGGTSGYKSGNLRFKVRSQRPFFFSPDNPATTGVKRQRLILKGLSSLLNVQIHVGLAWMEGTRKPDYPALPGTVQVTPFATTDGDVWIYGKPLELVPQTIPHQFQLGGPSRQGGSGALSVGGDFGATGGDGAEIVVEVDPAQYADQTFEGSLYVFVEADYNGQWWDIDTIQHLFGRLTLSNTDQIKIQTLAS